MRDGGSAGPAAPAAPPEGCAVEVAPGVLWARMPLPLALDHVNVWLLEDEGGWTAVDTGFSDERTRAAWESLAVGALGGRPIRRLICTHGHPDHVGLASWLVERFGAAFHATLAEWLAARANKLERLEVLQRAAVPFYRSLGVPDALLPPLLARESAYPDSVGPIPASFRRLREGDALSIGGVRWKVVAGRGHSSEHACLWAPERGLLISGDQVLPEITPNVSVWPSEPEAEPLSDFLATLEVLRRLPDALRVLPSHKRPFTGLHGRLDELTEHHRLRLEEVHRACAQPRTVYEVTQAMFGRPLDPHQMTFALGEAKAHVAHLARQGRLEQLPAGPGDAHRFVQRR